MTKVNMMYQNTRNQDSGKKYAIRTLLYKLLQF